MRVEGKENAFRNSRVNLPHMLFQALLYGFAELVLKMTMVSSSWVIESPRSSSDGGNSLP